jgi:Uncharacterized protein conserved in bacteria (DUF2252)
MAKGAQPTRLTPAERVGLGKAARTRVPRDRHAEFKAPADRADPIALLEQQAASRLGMRAYAEICAWTLARAHARSGDRIAIAAYLGGSDVFDQAVARFAGAYADQNERDHTALADAAAPGRITAKPGL